MGKWKKFEERVSITRCGRGGKVTICDRSGK